MILVVEPVFPNAHHAATNAGMLHAISIAAGAEPVVFAAHQAQLDAVAQSGGCDYQVRPMRVLASGGISLRRFVSIAAGLWRLIRELRPRLLICLGTQPETLFACRVLAVLRPGLGIIAVLHGNLHQAVMGWRSRDPRRRWFDDTSALRAAIGARSIRFAVLETSIRASALSLGALPADRTMVWPLPIPDREVWDEPHCPDPAKIRIAFLGSAKRAKGFGDFIDITRRLAARSDRYEFSLIGGLQDSFPAESLAHIVVPDGFLRREAFLRRLYAVDYVCLPLRSDTYTLTASGVIVDAIAALKPMITLETPAIRDVFASGPAGFLCADLQAMEAVMSDVSGLADPAQYQMFRANLRSQQQARTASGLAGVMAGSI